MGIGSPKGVEELEGKGIWIRSAAYAIDDTASPGTQSGLDLIRSDTRSDLWGVRAFGYDIAIRIESGRSTDLESGRSTDLGCDCLDARCGADAQLVAQEREVPQQRVKLKIVEHRQNTLAVFHLERQQRRKLALWPLLGEEVGAQNNDAVSRVRQAFIDLARETIAERDLVRIDPNAKTRALQRLCERLRDGGLVLACVADKDVPGRL